MLGIVLAYFLFVYQIHFEFFRSRKRKKKMQQTRTRTRRIEEGRLRLEAKMSPVPTERLQTKEAVFTPPEYTMKDIYDAIPRHCLRSDTFLSLSYILRDFIFVATLMGLASQIPLLPHPYLRFTAWATYAFTQGLVFTGLWEIAHEAGHGALSPYRWVNGVIGMVVHSLLLVPFYSWKITHATHHKSTNNLERDIAFVPDTKANYLAARADRSEGFLMKVWEVIEDTPFVTLVFLFFHQLIAWPIYLAINNFAIPRMAATPWWKRSHFYTGGDGPNFKPQDGKSILISDLGIAAMATVLWASVKYFGGWNVALFYFFPYVWTNHWILTITYLQHTDLKIPYYPSKSWSFLRGAASTVDRDFGFIGRVIFHGAIEGHVVHHHSSRIPFYHAAEATAAVRKVMGSHYQSDFETPYVWAFWKNFRACRYVEETEPGSNVFFFANSN